LGAWQIYLLVLEALVFQSVRFLMLD